MPTPAQRPAGQSAHVKTVMHPQPECISPGSTLMEAAQLMRRLNCGVLPVRSGDNQPEGIITDRDIVVRAVAEGRDVATEIVQDYMTSEICSCHQEETLEEAAGKMNDFQVSRLLVEDDNGRICGILTFGSIMRKQPSKSKIADVVECAVGNKAA